MQEHFIDASALIKRYYTEKGSEKIERTFADKENQIFISDLTPVEIARILSQIKRSGVISEQEKRYAMRAFFFDVENRMFMQPYYDENILTAVSIAFEYELNPIACIQLAIALGIIAENMIFVSTDIDLCNAARSEGLRVLNPEE